MLFSGRRSGGMFRFDRRLAQTGALLHRGLVLLIGAAILFGIALIVHALLANGGGGTG